MGGSDAHVSALREGAPFGRWSIARVHPEELGAIRVDVRDLRGGEFALEILARDSASSRPPAEVGELAIYVCNGGDGWSPTAEEHGLAAMALASLLDKNGETARVDGLLTQTERFARHKDSLV